MPMKHSALVPYIAHSIKKKYTITYLHLPELKTKTMVMRFFNKKRKEVFRHRGALFLAIILLLESGYPTAALALTSGPTQPEFGSFEPVSTTSMVNEFSGDFTYNIPVINIPGANGGGYALSLSY